MSGQDDIAEEGWVDDSDMSSGVSNGGTKFHSVDHLWKEMGKVCVLVRTMVTVMVTWSGVTIVCSGTSLALDANVP